MLFVLDEPPVEARVTLNKCPFTLLDAFLKDNADAETTADLLNEMANGTLIGDLLPVLAAIKKAFNALANYYHWTKCIAACPRPDASWDVERKKQEWQRSENAFSQQEVAQKEAWDPTNDAWQIFVQWLCLKSNCNSSQANVTWLQDQATEVTFKHHRLVQNLCLAREAWELRRMPGVFCPDQGIDFACLSMKAVGAWIEEFGDFAGFDGLRD